MREKHHDQYGKWDDLRKIKIDEEETYIEGVKNYQLNSNYVPVLDRKYLNKLIPEKTNISVCGNAPFEFDEDNLIKQAIEEVKKYKDYVTGHGTEHIGEYSIFQNIGVDDFMLESYGFYLDSEGEYSLILWFTPNHHFNSVRKHIFWYGKKNNMGDFY
ncbi:MAG: hypothetical protein KJ674_01830 [Nanoarchaeota archaeon]|nr:hypothetical protein [Nanoarchaeota archaeon]